MKRDFIVWEGFLEGRDGYYLEYCPGRTDFPQAHLNVVFTSAIPTEKVAEIHLIHGVFEYLHMARMLK